MILDGSGGLLWFKRLPAGAEPRTFESRNTKANPS